MPHPEAPQALEDLEELANWRKFCATVMQKTFPPDSSDFPAEALERDEHMKLDHLSNWAIACEEVLDTEHSHVYLRRCYEELLRRGKTPDDIRAMREFAWLTAGWLNFPMMVWDWCSLDEGDIRIAINWLWRRRQISWKERRGMMRFVKQHA